MSITISDTSESFERELPPSGIQPAVCSKIFDLGRQVTEYNGERKIQHKVLFVWELAATMQSGQFQGKRFVVHKEYTASLHEKATLRKDLESWKGKSIPEDKVREGVDLEKFLKVPATLNIMHKTSKRGNEYAVVNGVMPEQSDAPMLVPELPADWCPEWIKNKMDEALDDDRDHAGEVGKPEPEEAAIF